MATARASHEAALLQDGSVLVAGGVGNQGTSLASVERYVPSTSRWSSAASLRTARSSFGFAVLDTNAVVAAGGSRWDGVTSQVLAAAERFSLSSGTWTTLPSMASARSAFSLVALPRGRALASGGYQSSQSWLATTELYIEPVPTPRPTPTATPTPTVVPPPPPARKEWVKVRAKGALLLTGDVPRREGCRGAIRLTLKRGNRRIATKTTRLTSRCRWSWTFTVARSKVAGARKLILIVRFGGNRRVEALRYRETCRPSRAALYVCRLT
jgi:hypothetical protein